MCRQRVPDDGGCNMEAPLAEPGPVPRNQHVTAFSRTEVCLPGDVSDGHTDVLEIGWAGAADTFGSGWPDIRLFSLCGCGNVVDTAKMLNGTGHRNQIFYLRTGLLGLPWKKLRLSLKSIDKAFNVHILCSCQVCL